MCVSIYKASDIMSAMGRLNCCILFASRSILSALECAAHLQINSFFEQPSQEITFPENSTLWAPNPAHNLLNKQRSLHRRSLTEFTEQSILSHLAWSGN